MLRTPLSNTATGLRLLGLGFSVTSLALSLHAAELSHTPTSEGVSHDCGETTKDVTAPQTTRQDILFVDAGVKDTAALMKQVRGHVEVHVVRGGLFEIAQILENRRGVDSVQIFSHGEPGAIILNGEVVDAAALGGYAPQIQMMKQALAPQGDILLYGCSTGAVDGKRGDLVSALASMTGKDVAASVDPSGSARQGGNWVLERQIGRIETELFATNEGAQSYDGLLAAPESENFDSVTVDGSGWNRGQNGQSRTLNGWTFSVLRADGNLDPNGHIDYTNATFETSLANDGTDKAAYLVGDYIPANIGQAAAVLASTSGEAFAFQSITVELGISDGGDYRLVGYRNGSSVSGATQDFIAPYFPSNGGTTVTVSGTAWQNLDAVRIVRQNGVTDISILVDDIVVGPAVFPAPTVTASHINISGASGTSGAYKIGDTVTATWNNTATGDHSAGVTSVTMDFSQFGGGSAVTATNSGGTWTASYAIVSGSIDTTNRNVSVKATTSGGSTTTAGTQNATVDNIPLTVTDGWISVSGGTGTNGAFVLGNTVMATWNNTANGDYNLDTISSVTVDFTQFGGGSAVAATNSAGTWTATYTIVTNPPTSTNLNVSVTATDNAGNATTSADTTNATFNSNTAPVIGNLNGNSVTYTKGSLPVIIDAGSDATVADADSADFNTGNVTVAITSNRVSTEDVLSIRNQGNGAGQIGTSGSAVSYGGAQIGTVSGGTSTSDLVISLNASATPTAVQALVRNLIYNNTNFANPNTNTRSITVTINDGDGGTSTGAVCGVTINNVNLAPVVTATSGVTAFTEGAGAVVVDSGITVSDVDNTTLASATVYFTAGLEVLSDSLSFTNTSSALYGNITGSYALFDGMLTLSSAGNTATLAQWQAALRSVKFNNSSTAPSTLTRTILFQVNDGSLHSNESTKQVSVTAVNDAPTVSISAGTTSFVEDEGPVVVDAGILIDDVDNTTLGSALVILSANAQLSEDSLAFTNVSSAQYGNITGSYNAANGILTLTSSGRTATLAQWQAALRSVTFNNNSQTPNGISRYIAFQVHDGVTGTTSGLKTVSVTAMNDAPVVTVTSGVTAFTEGAGPRLVDNAISVLDPDNTTLASATVSITGNFQSSEDSLEFTNDGSTNGNITATYQSVSGVMTLQSAGQTATLAQWQAALRNVKYHNNSQNPNTSNRTISFVVNDGSTSSTAVTKQVSVTAVNDAPTVSISAGTTSFVEDGGPVVVDAGVLIDDVDNTTLASAWVVLFTTPDFLNDSLAFTNTSSALYGNITGSYNSSGGFLSLSSQGRTATLAQWQAALRSVTFTNNSHAPIAGNRSIAFNVDDGSLYATSTYKTLSVTAVNDAPTVVVSAGTTSFVEDSGPVAIDSGIIVNDEDNTTLASATVSINGNFQSSEDSLEFTNDGSTNGNITATYQSVSGVMTLQSAGQTATLAQWQAALRNVKYSNNSQNPNTSNRTISFVVNDGEYSSTAVTKQVSVTAVNDAPTVIVSAGTTSFVEDEGPVVVDAGVLIDDVDNTTLAGAKVVFYPHAQFFEDSLAFTNTSSSLYGNITASYDASGGFLKLSSQGSTATLAQWQAALRSVTYNNNIQNPSGTSRTILFIVDDGGLGTGSTLKTISITSVNDAPVNTVPAAQSTPQNSQLTFSSANGNVISVSDVDTTLVNNMSVTLSVGHGTLTLPNTAGITFLSSSSNGSASIVIQGLLSHLNSAISTLIYSPTLGYHGSDTLTITSNDYGSSGTGGAKTDTDTVQITVTPINPVVTSVSSSATNGTYKIASIIPITVTFDQPVTVDTTGGLPSLVLETGSIDRAAIYSSGSTTSTLTFNYTVQEGDHTADLDYNSTSALSVNGGTIRNTSQMDAMVTLPAPGSSNSIAGQKAIVIDGIRPTATITMADTALRAGETSLITFTFSEEVNGLTDADLTVGNGGISQITKSLSDSKVWTGTFTPTASHESTGNIITLDLTGVTDLAGNAGTGTSSSVNYTIDTKRPTVTITMSDTALKASETSLVTFTFSEEITDFTNGDLTIQNGALSPVTKSTTNPKVYTTTFTPYASVEIATNVITLDLTGVTDLAGNAGTGTATSDNYSIDTKLPTITAVSLTAGQYGLNASIPVTVTFSEPVTVGTSPLPTLSIATEYGGPLQASYTSGSGSTTLTFTAVVPAGIADINGVTLAQQISLNGGTIRDAAGNDATLTLANITGASGVLIDSSPPVVSAPLPDQIIVIGEAAIVVDLSQHFSDHGSAALTYTVAYTDSTKASATISGNNLTLTGLANGVTSITITADDGHGGTVSDTFDIAVGTPDPTVVQTSTAASYNGASGMFEMTVNVTNTTALPIYGFRLYVDYTSYLSAQPSMRLYNATATLDAGFAYVDVPFPTAVDAVKQVKLVFYTSTRVFPTPFTPVLTVETLPYSQLADTNGAGAPATLTNLPDQNKMIEFQSEIGKWYRVRYSHDMVHWQDCPVPLQAGSTRMQWIDSGPPFTESAPSTVPARYYIVNEITAP